MPRPLKLVLLLSAACCIAVAGYVAGYFQGYVGGRGHPAAAEALSDLVVLTNLRDGKRDGAIRILELSLDARLIQREAYVSSHLQLAPLFSMSRDDENAMARIRSHRHRYPSVVEDPQVRELIEKALSEASR